MTVILPSKTWLATQEGDVIGQIIRTKNLSLANPGYLSLARKPLCIYSHDDSSGFGSFLAAITDNTYTYALTDSFLFVFDLKTQIPFEATYQTNDAHTPVFGNWSDLVLFNSLPHASGDTVVNYLEALGPGQTWHTSNPISSLSSSYPHPLCVSEHQQYLAVGNGNSVALYDTGYNLITTLTIPSDYIVTCIAWLSDNLYIGTRNIRGGSARMFVWNGSGVAAQAGYRVKADWIYSICEYSDTITLALSSGQIVRFNGGGFKELCHFPVYDTPYSWTSNASNRSLVGKMASRGMNAFGDTLYLNIDGSLNGSALVAPGIYLPDQPSGLWTFDPQAGLVHRAGYMHKDFQQLTVTALNSNRLTVSAPHQLSVGDPVFSATSLSPITYQQVYYAIPESTTVTQLALSRSDALNNRPIAIPGPLSGTQYLYTDRYEAFSQNVINSPGGVAVLQTMHPSLFIASEVLFGGSTLDETYTAKGVMLSLGMGQNRGYAITARIPSKQIQDSWQRLALFFEQLNLASEQIIVKYRIGTRFGLPTPLCYSGSATWTSGNTFTINPTLKPVADIQIGDEIEIVQGQGAGYLAHVTAINPTSTLYTFTIDETLPVNNGDLFDFVAENWSKLKIVSNADVTNVANFLETNLAKRANWIQFKVEIRGNEDTRIRALQAINAAAKPSD